MKTLRLLLALGVTSVGCSAQGGTGGGVGLTPTGIDCSALCARLVGAPNCAASAPGECNSICSSLLTSAGTACGAQLNALSSCASVSPVRCVATGVNPFTNCNAEYLAAFSCSRRPAADAGP